jgi:hypothetical protein
MTDALRRTLRTGLQVVLGLAAGLPELVHTADLPSTLPGLGIALAVAAAVTRLMASPVVDSLLPGWLKAAPAKASLPPIGPGPSATVSLVAETAQAVQPIQPVSPPVPPTTPDGGASA